MSSALRSPALGPIVGHTTSTSANIWIRGSDIDDNRTIGVAALFLGNTYQKGQSKYFRLQREYDRTGVVIFEGLHANTAYVVKTGTLVLETLNPDEVLEDDEVFNQLPPAEGWLKQLEGLPEEASARFSTFSSAIENEISFVFGSCRYPGLLWLKKKADKIFGSILQRIVNPKAGDEVPKLFLMVGDQIYADTLPKDLGLSVADTEAEFRERYSSAFGAPNTRALLSKIPTYMILDDHEIEDNWVMGRLHTSPEKRFLFNMAIKSYLSYQWIHSPRNFGNSLYYNFESEGFPFFVLDGRTQRIRDDNDNDLTDNHLLGRPGKGTKYKGQIDIVCDWLIEQQKSQADRPKFIVSASVFVPNEVTTTKGNLQKSKDDSWAAFPNTRKQLLLCIIENNIQNVVFLSGDIHCSNVAEMEFFDTQGVKSNISAFSITSSAFYWPYPFADGNPLDYVHDSDIENDNFEISFDWKMKYKAWSFQQNDNFSQVDLNWNLKKLVVRTFDSDGKALDESVLILK